MSTLPTCPDCEQTYVAHQAEETTRRADGSTTTVTNVTWWVCRCGEVLAPDDAVRLDWLLARYPHAEELNLAGAPSAQEIVAAEASRFDQDDDGR